MRRLGLNHRWGSDIAAAKVEAGRCLLGKHHHGQGLFPGSIHPVGVSQEVPGLANIPPHLELDKNKLTAKVISKCEREWVALEINELLVVEYYSRKV